MCLTYTILTVVNINLMRRVTNGLEIQFLFYDTSIEHVACNIEQYHSASRKAEEEFDCSMPASVFETSTILVSLPIKQTTTKY